MPWKEMSTMSQRREVVELARAPDANIRELCRRYKLSPATVYKWLARYTEQGWQGLADRSRRPHRSPGRTATAIEEIVLEAREEHPAWGGRKLAAWLKGRGQSEVPSASTVSMILRRHGRIEEGESDKHRAWQRFEQAAPNELWQMDFKGHFALEQGRCHPLTVLDDHSRFSVVLQACGDERLETVRGHLRGAFRRYGLPRRILADNGSPWGCAGYDEAYSELGKWFIRLGVELIHGRPYHPQTQGKEERFHRTLKAEVLRDYRFGDLQECQQAFDRWREQYNHERPHEALGMAVPISRYRASARPFGEQLPEVEYGPDYVVRVVHDQGRIQLHGKRYRVGRAFTGERVGLLRRPEPREWDVYYCQERVARVRDSAGDALADPQPCRRGTSDVSLQLVLFGLSTFDFRPRVPARQLP